MNRDRAYIYELIAHATRLMVHIASVTHEEFLINEDKQDLVILRFMLMGETSRKVSDALKLRFPEVKWRPMTNLRKVAIHEYLGINYDELWRIGTTEVPITLVQLKHILQTLDREADPSASKD